MTGRLTSPRVVVVGNTGSGKSTLAGQISAAWGIPHIELDALNWLPDWQERPTAELRQLVQEATAAPAWVVDGNYSDVRDMIWQRAETLIWLDYNIFVILGRLIPRTLRRAWRKESLWGTNQESLKNFWPHKDSLIVWALRKQWSRRRQYEQLLQEPRFLHLKVVRLRSPRATRRWLKERV